MPITLKDGKRITPQPPPMDRLARRADIERSIPDAVLERYGVTRRDV
jgi:hypothetical protein